MGVVNTIAGSIASVSVGLINGVIIDNDPQPTNWILDTGYWDDNGVWDDSAFWNDGI